MTLVTLERIALKYLVPKRHPPSSEVLVPESRSWKTIRGVGIVLVAAVDCLLPSPLERGPGANRRSREVECRGRTAVKFLPWEADRQRAGRAWGQRFSVLATGRLPQASPVSWFAWWETLPDPARAARSLYWAGCGWAADHHAGLTVRGGK